jgi:Zn-dependent protease
MKEADPHEFYAAGLTDGSALTCYAVRWPDSKQSSWLLPQHVTRSDYLRPGNYTTTTGHRLWQACALVPTFASGLGSRLVGELDGFVAMRGSTEPPPWLPIGLIGVALVAVAYIVLVWLRPGVPGPSPPPSAIATVMQGPPRVKPIYAVLWQNALLGLLVMSIEAAILIEIIRSLAEARIEFGLALLVLATAWVLCLLPPWLRRNAAVATVIIPASPHTVWAALSDRTVSLDPEIVSAEITSTGPVGVGTTYREVQQVTKGPLVEFVSLITRYEPGRELAIGYPQLWHRQAHRTVLTPVGAGTLVTRTHELTMSPTLAIIGGILFARQLRQPTEVNLHKWLRQLHQRVTGIDGSRAEAAPPARSRGLLAGMSFGLALMVVTALLSLGGYALLFGLTLGALIMAILMIHELGHYAEARRSGLGVRLPFFIPFIGAAVTMKTMPGDAVVHARIALAGPLIGTLAVAAAFLAAAPTNSSGILFFAQLCAVINLVNLVPIGILDGGSILAPISRWISVVGLVLAVGLVGLVTVAGQFSPLLLVIVAVTAFLVVDRFRRHRMPYYRNVGRRMQVAIGAIWLATICYLIFAVGAATQGLLLA